MRNIVGRSMGFGSAKWKPSLLSAGMVIPYLAVYGNDIWGFEDDLLLGPFAEATRAFSRRLERQIEGSLGEHGCANEGLYSKNHGGATACSAWSAAGLFMHVAQTMNVSVM
eukprot:5819918-Amphidinium_carterae.3